MSSSIKDVARLAGVSVATVSHVINETRFVTDATRAKVLLAIDQLQYSPNILARKFKTGSRDTVGFVVPDIANGYFATLIEQVEEVLQSHGFRLIVCNTREDVARELDILRMLSSGVVDGLVVASTLDDYQQMDELLPAGFPVVLVDRTLSNAPVDTISTDNFGAIHNGVTALIGRGHRRIGFMASVRHLSTTSERVRAYRAALEEHAIPWDERLIRYSESLTESVKAPADALLDLGCTAIVASNNMLTGRLVAALHTGNWLPREIKILGYRDPAHFGFFEHEAEWLEEPISEMGRLAGEAIVRRMSDPTTERLHTVLRASFLAQSEASHGA